MKDAGSAVTLKVTNLTEFYSLILPPGGVAAFVHFGGTGRLPPADIANLQQGGHLGGGIQNYHILYERHEDSTDKDALVVKVSLVQEPGLANRPASQKLCHVQVTVFSTSPPPHHHATSPSFFYSSMLCTILKPNVSRHESTHFPACNP